MLVVRDDAAALVGLQTRGGRADQRVGAGADGDDDRVQIERELAALDRHRTAAAGGVRLTQLHLLALETLDHVGVGIADDLERGGQELEDDALFLGVVDLLQTGGHFGLAAAVDDINLVRAHALGAACRVHCDVAAADNGDLLGAQDRGVGVFLVGLHQVDAGQVLIGRVNAVVVLARYAHEGGQTGARADKNGLVAVGKQIVDGLGAADNEVQHEFNAQLLQGVDLLLDDRLGQTELGDTVHQNAARGVQRLEDGDLIAHAGQIARAGQAGRAGADDGALVAVGLGTGGLGLFVLHGVVGNKALQTADRDRLALDAAHALAFTLALLRADTAADGGQGGGLLDLGGGLEELALSDERDELRDLDADRAARYAGLVLAVQAALCLFERHFGGVAQRDFLKVLVADVGVLLGHRALIQTHIRHLYLTSILYRLQ